MAVITYSLQTLRLDVSIENLNITSRLRSSWATDASNSSGSAPLALTIFWRSVSIFLLIVTQVRNSWQHLKTYTALSVPELMCGPQDLDSPMSSRINEWTSRPRQPLEFQNVKCPPPLPAADRGWRPEGPPVSAHSSAALLPQPAATSTSMLQQFAVSFATTAAASLHQLL